MKLMELKKLFMFGAVAATVLSACGEKDYYDPQYEPEKKKADYEANFIKKYGQIAANQEWDFTTGDWSYGGMDTRGDEIIPVGKATTATKLTAALRSGLANTLTEHVDRYDKVLANGKQGYVLMSQGPFTIVPISHGQCNEWTLLVNGQKIANFSEINSMLGQSTVGTSATDTKERSIYGWTIDTKPGTLLNLQLKCTKSNAEYMYENDIVGSVNAYIGMKKNGKIDPTYQYDPVAGVTIGTNTYVKKEHTNVTQGSLLMSYDADIFKGITDINTFKRYILFEDAFHSSTDLDYNDFILGIAGNIPEPKEVKDEDVLVDKNFAKRYMMEDLGSTDDFDFNDVVVDVWGKIYEHYNIHWDETGAQTIQAKEPSNYGGLTATVRHKGGILPFQVFIGDVSISGNEKISPNMDPSDLVREDVYEMEEYKIQDEATFNKADDVIRNNKIKLVVYNTEETTESGDVQTWEVKFGETGKVPAIIAADTNKMWSNERVALNWLDWTKK